MLPCNRPFDLIRRCIEARADILAQLTGMSSTPGLKKLPVIGPLQGSDHLFDCRTKNITRIDSRLVFSYVSAGIVETEPLD